MEQSLQKERDRCLIKIVRELLLSDVAFQEILEKHKKGSLQFSDIVHWVDDKGQTLLYDLKEQCHYLFRDRGKGPRHRNEWLLDLVIGSIFHEAMKLKENIYQLENYRPRYLQHKMEARKTAYEKDYIRQFERIISRAEQGVSDGIEETQSLFRDAAAQLIDVFKGNSKNTFFVRFLLEHEPLLQKVYGSKGVREIFDLSFEKGLSDAYELAGRSYLQSEHYDLASTYFAKGLKLDSRSNDLQSLLNFSLGMNAYYNNTYSKALSYFRKLIHLQSSVIGRKEYLKKVGEVCQKMALELREGKGGMGTRKATFLADQIKKML